MYLSVICSSPSPVGPYVGTWIEILLLLQPGCSHCVVPYVGTWIEMVRYRCIGVRRSSRSLRGNVDRNFNTFIEKNVADVVVPYVGTWIEIVHYSPSSNVNVVVPYVGTWIEMV